MEKSKEKRPSFNYANTANLFIVFGSLVLGFCCGTIKSWWMLVFAMIGGMLIFSGSRLLKKELYQLGYKEGKEGKPPKY
ncbi:MAG: hypothetical protein FWF46_09160 [Oscillospiraceae bacterium]|nr:hypothetical protein [Oscillospiraceae bacterium]